MYKSITIKSYAKINLSLDVGKVMENRMHPVDTVMQAVDLFDVVTVEVGGAEAVSTEPAATEAAATDSAATEPVTTEAATDSATTEPVATEKTATGLAATEETTTDPVITESAVNTETTVAEHGTTNAAPFPEIELIVQGSDLTTGSDNLAYRAAKLMLNRYGNLIPGELKKIRITLEKNIPLAAGLAGGSGNAAAVLHGLNVLWDLKLKMEDLLALGTALGADVPFCIVSQGKANLNLPESITADPMAATCARGRGTGADLEPLTALSGAVIIIKPSFSLSTKEVYEGFDKCVVEKRPDNDRMAEALYNGNRSAVIEEMLNLLELYSLKAAPEIASLKALMEETLGAEKVLMSGSGPSVYALFPSLREAEDALAVVSAKGTATPFGFAPAKEAPTPSGALPAMDTIDNTPGYFIATASLL